ncbi:yemanuclein isoform X1 [Andrena cerasifolii]|uniref:yemanuclein isoform X1 n=1 Tax=Andrena cerasifolii TaxID=2819439 RepID=UPI004037F909
MSEAKRVPLQTLEFPESLGYATKKEKKGEKGKQLAPSFRFTLTLPESNEKACPEFNYAQLLKAAEKKRRKEVLKRGEENATNGLPFDDEDEDDDKLRDMARRFEAKYGTSTTGKKRRKYDGYVDLGAGYDENDSFIDNTDAYDEIVPEGVTTAHGGFYINCGALEFRAADRHSLVHNNNNNNTNNSNDEESSESSEEDTEDVDSPKRSEKRNLSSSDEDEAEDITGDQPRKKQKVDENGEKKPAQDNIIKKKKKPQTSQDQQNSQQDGDAINRRKEKGEITDAEGVSEDQEDKKKPDKIDTQKIKNTSDKKFDIKKFEKKTSNNSSNGFDGKKLELKKLGTKDSNIDDAIESVVNAARVEDESSRDTTDSGKSRCIGTESDCDDVDKEEAPLPDSLPENVVEIVNKLKARAENSKEGKTKFFNTAVNGFLLSLEKRLRMLSSPSLRLDTYGHLSRFLPCSKMALQNRAKKLYVEDLDFKIKDLIQRLKDVINGIMPSVMCKYLDECQKVAEKKEMEESPANAESSDDEDNCENSDKSKIPKKRFPWTDEAKKLVCEIANARRQCYNVLRPRKLSMYTFVGSYLLRQVLPLWPHGYMNGHTLLKFVDDYEPVPKKKSKKLKEIGSDNTTTSGNTVYSSAKIEISAVNSVSSQEKDKTATSAPKVPNITENSTNFVKQPTTKSNDNAEKRQHSVKHKDKNKEASNTGQQHDSLTVNNSTVGKISVVPTAQLMAQKPVKCHVEKINLMDLANSSLSITPVNDYHKTSTKVNENKKDVVSITAYSETSNVLPNTNEVPQSGHHSVHRQEASYTQPQHSSYPTSSQTSPHSKPVPLKHRLLHESTETKSDKKSEDKDIDIVNKTEKKDKRRERCVEVKHKSYDVKKRKKDQKVMEKQGNINSDVVPMQQQQPQPPLPLPPPTPSLTKEEQEQRQNEETIAATNYLSQIINDDASTKGITDKRKDTGLILEEPVNNMVVQPTEQEKDVQMVMRSLKELQELQEMKYSPSNSPVNSNIQKPNKSNAQCAIYQDEYSRLCIKKDVKLKSKDESQW